MVDEFKFAPEVDQEAVYRQLHAKFGKEKPQATPTESTSLVGEGRLEKILAQILELSPGDREPFVKLLVEKLKERSAASGTPSLGGPSATLARVEEELKGLRVDVKRLLKHFGLGT